MGDNAVVIPFEQGWTHVIKAIALDPLEKMLDEGFKGTRLFSPEDYSKVYTICYNMCTQKAPNNWSDQIYHRHGETISNYLNNDVLPALRNHGKQGELLLEEFVIRGENHKIMNRWYQRFFAYLDRYHVRYHSLPSLEDAGLRYYKNIVYDNIKNDITSAILQMINADREGTVVKDELIRKCVLIFESMGMGSLDTYINDFEIHLLESTREFYTMKSLSWISQDSTPAYLIRCEKALDDERTRVQLYMNADSELKLLQVLDKELLAKKQTELLEKEGSGCQVLLMNDMLEDLSRMYRLFSRITDGLVPISDIFRQHILDRGNEKINQRLSRVESKDETGKEKEKETNDDPQFIKDLLSVHDKYLDMVNNQFQGNTLFQKALKDAFNDLVNREVGKFKTADLLSSFTDRLLKTGSTERLSDQEIEEHLEKSVQLFTYLTEQDLFAEIYRNQLARRLLNQRSASDDMERLMISKLKLRCGGQFTSKMEGMLSDLAVAAESGVLFEKFCKENQQLTQIGKMEFSVQTLTTGNWPSYKNIDINLPSIMQRCTVVYKDYYNSHNGSSKRLQWTQALGSATVKGFFGPKGKKDIDLQVVTLQAIVLLAFNKDAVLPGGIQGNPISFPDLLLHLGMPENNTDSVNILKKVLHSLSCGQFKVLKRISSSEPTEKGAEGDGKKEKGADKGAIKTTDTFAFNEQFSCNQRKIRIPMALLDDNVRPGKVEEDRSIAIEASIVRTMKSRLTLSHQQLVAEVLSQLSFFRPDPKLIKKRIESLIDRDYLERDADNPNTYKYMA